MESVHRYGARERAFAGRSSGRLHRTLNLAREADEVLCEHGMVFGTKVHNSRDAARRAYRTIIDVLVETGEQQRHTLRGHAFRDGHGWRWAIEHLGRR